jgi:hypothetical protein
MAVPVAEVVVLRQPAGEPRPRDDVAAVVLETDGTLGVLPAAPDHDH